MAERGERSMKRNGREAALGDVVVSPRPAARQGDSLAETAYRLIKRDIVRCDLAPGRQVAEPELTARYTTGRAAVRSALNRLYQEGFVAVLPRQGYVIAPITLRDVRELAHVRQLLEPPAARIAAGRVDVSLLRRLDADYRGLAQTHQPDDVERFMRANAEFHLAVARASGNDRLTAMIAELLTEMERHFHLGVRLQPAAGSVGDQLEHDHAALIEALEAGDGAAAERLMAEQIAHSQQVITGRLMASGILDSINLAPSGSA